VQDSFGAVTYQGDAGTVMRTVDSSTQVQVNVNNVDAFGPPGADVFSMFDRITSDLQNNPDGLTSDLSTISTALDRMTSAQAKEGAAYNRLSDMTKSVTGRVATLTNNLSSVEDLDTAKAATALTMQQVSYQASLAAMSKVLQLSLTDFLR
jgi:flagellar hook-associated protein 3 FlgL